MNNNIFNRKKIIPLLTAFISILIGLIYLGFVFVLDFRAPMIPPPSEALISVVVL